MSDWQKVKMADDCEPCSLCGEPFCELCDLHYADCNCPGCDQTDEFDYEFRGDVLYARPIQ